MVKVFFVPRAYELRFVPGAHHKKVVYHTLAWCGARQIPRLFSVEGWKTHPPSEDGMNSIEVAWYSCCVAEVDTPKTSVWGGVGVPPGFTFFVGINSLIGA